MLADFTPTILGAKTIGTENPELFAKFQPKIAAYQKALADAVLSEYALPAELIPKIQGLNVIDIVEKNLSSKELEITELKAVDLAAKIAAGKYTSVEVFKAYAKRATAAHQLVNCGMEIFMDEGLKRAEELDAHFKETGRTIGILHGVPVSVKEHYDYKGKITHGAYASLIDNVSTETNACLQNLYNAGCVFYIRTSEPQSLMHLCSNNNITGLTKNPHNTSLTTGGSSSGEGAIAAMKGSALGVGSDIGGSIRCPAAFCGVWGLRPTTRRVPMFPMVPSGKKVQDITEVVLGPLARSAEDLALFMKVQADAKPWESDASIVPLQWKEVADPTAEQLKVAIVYDDGVCKPTPPIVRGLAHTAQKLKAAGVKVVEWNCEGVAELITAAGKSYNADGNYGQKTLLGNSGEPLCELSKIALSFGCGDGGLSAKEYQHVTYTRNHYREVYLNQMKELDVDFIISPTYVSVAAKPETVHYWGYTNLWNILDYPNVIFPTTLKVDPELDAADKSYVARNDVEKYEYGLYDDAQNFTGAPICLQVTGKRYRDEDTVAAAKVIASIVNA